MIRTAISLGKSHADLAQPLEPARAAARRARSSRRVWVAGSRVAGVDRHRPIISHIAIVLSSIWLKPSTRRAAHAGTRPAPDSGPAHDKLKQTPVA